MRNGDNLIITGFMGTGKTSVGQEVARRLGREFVDMDALIEARTGLTIADIFAQRGEAYFRQLEAALCRDLAARTGLVIATGGGTLIPDANRESLGASGPIICLKATPDEILRRLEAARDRPLLNVADPRAEIERLLEVRREAYQAIPWQVDTTGLSVEEVATRVVELAEVITLSVRYPGGEYLIHIGDGLLAHIGEALRAAGVPPGCRVAVVSTPVVAPLYSARVEASLRSAELEPFACSIPDGEQYKTLATVATLYDQFLAGRLDRNGIVLSLGGGVTGDVAGFAAATFMRGVRFVQVPTTLLAMVDASVGGKTGLNLPQGKNLVGAFKQPALVVIDPTVLATLPPEEFRSGMAEVIKHGILGDPDLFAELEAGTAQVQLAIHGPQIERALRVKIAVVEEDPYEQGRRAVLNLGHTVGHALEKLSGFAMRHGEAVSIGMVAAARIAIQLGQADPSLADRIEAVLTAWGLPVRYSTFNAKAIWKAMTHDKKRQGQSLRWVLPRAIGDVIVTDQVGRAEVMSVLASLQET